MSARRRSEWWRDAFKRPYLECYAHRDDGSADVEATFVAKLLRLRRGARLLDAGCGAGRHVRAFCRLGAQIVGVDLSRDLLAEAMRRGAAPYVQADLRRLPFDDAAFKHVVSLFTSFGYFDARGDRRHLHEMRRVLRPGGTFVIDFLNPTRVRDTLVPESTRKVGRWEIREKRVIRHGRVEKNVAIRDATGKRPTVWLESVRLYGRADLERMLKDSGFRVRSVHGDLAGSEWKEDAERLVLTAEAA